MADLSPRLERDWSLFEDWCEAFGHPVLPTTPDTIVAFLRAFPSGVPTNTLRVRAIRRTHEQKHVPLDLTALRDAADVPPFDSPKGRLSLLRTGDGATQSVGEALAQLPKAKHGKSSASGLRGRRDAFVVVLFAYLGYSRQQLRSVTPADVTTDPLTVQGHRIPQGDDPASCPACAVTRWLRVVVPAELGRRTEVTEILDPRAFDAAVHDCEGWLDDEWTSATTLLPAIDQHGWVSAHTEISTRTVSAIAARVQQFTGLRELGHVPVVAKVTRFDEMSTTEFTEEMDDFDRKVAEALAWSNDILDTANEASDTMHRLMRPEAG